MPERAKPKSSIERLIAQARAGEKAALEELFRATKEQMERWNRHPNKTVGFSRPSDLAQDAFLRAFRSFESFRGSTEEEWFAWLRQILEKGKAQTARDAGRQKRDVAMETPLDETSEPEVADPKASPSHTAARKEQWHQLLAQMYELPEDQQKAVWLHHCQGHSAAEVAEQMKKSKDAVEALIQRGMKTLREHFAGIDLTEALRLKDGKR